MVLLKQTYAMHASVNFACVKLIDEHNG